MTLIEQKNLAPQIFEMTLYGKLVKEMEVPGQFLHLRVPSAELLLRRPISLAEIDQTTETCKLIYRVEGKGTDIFSKMKDGDQIDVMGPLGNGFDIGNVKAEETAFIIGGGIGAPPMYELSKELISKGVKVIQLLGFATKNVIFYEEKFKKLGVTRIATDDGTYGMHGHVGHLIDQAIEEFGQPDLVYACGSNGLLKAVDRKFDDHPKAYISMEARMACAVGACYACVVHVKDDETGMSYVKVCDDGPIFETGKLVI
ncbi:dihydroorotate dehydrogenase electron transfer subunit [Lactovum miscens]|uniref:Dihydroorotate dehydrogenase B (NAD(+)), electron transfer subunit n=2 Tax=Lactovum miscens TaxID=190387 RepID=A0A841C598_9LACT|nr:dihydroorotate dehydrogenase electron transfer subunit [Lactovum miscens]